MRTRTLQSAVYIILVATFSSAASLQDAAAREPSAVATVGTDVKIGDGEQMPWKLPIDEQAKKGAELYERLDTREEGLVILKKAANEGSPFAMARLSALYYLGEGGLRQDYDKALRLMKSAVARGFPESLLPIRDAEAALHSSKSADGNPKPVAKPGSGYPGRIAPYSVSAELKRHLDRFNLTARWFYRDSLADGMVEPCDVGDLLANKLPYLLFTPKRGQRPVPMVVYFGGTGEQGTDLAAHFNQTTLFSIVTSPEFQKRHPCYLFAPMVPKGSDIRCLKSWSPPTADLVCDAMYAVIRAAKNPQVDTNRIYLTGLSYGGSAAWTFPFGYPGRFAASLPVAGFASVRSVPDERPGSIWLLYNEGEYSSQKGRKELADIAHIIAERGGEFRFSSFPDKGHNAWDKAWREDAPWEWMFSKTTTALSGGNSQNSSRSGSTISRSRVFLEGAACTAVKPGRDGGTGPERAADGLDATCYVSEKPLSRGDWWQIEFAQPASGRITVKSGYRDGTGYIKSAHVETSNNGSKWTIAGHFRRSNGECTFVPLAPVKLLRVVSESQSGETLVLREVVVQ